LGVMVLLVCPALPLFVRVGAWLGSGRSRWGGAGGEDLLP